MAKKNKPKYYVVWSGREVGVFDSWDICKKSIQGFDGAKYKAFESRSAADAAFTKSPFEFIGKNVAQPTLPAEEIVRYGQPIGDSIAVDAAYNGKEMEYKGVYTKTKQELFKSPVYEDATNNIGEFLAIVHALGYLKKQQSAAPVYSDSLTAIHWVTIKHANTKLKRTAANQSLFLLIERAEKWLHENTYPNKICKWETRAWGENPADFGRK